MAEPRPLDFLCIGAPKAGTTSLFHYLRGQQGVFMPAIKEAPYFCDDDRFAGGWAAFWNEYLQGAADDDLVGKVTPQYMGDLRVARRIEAEMPDVRLFCILRNPIDRAFSDYRMRRRVGKEERTFDEVVESQSRAEELRRARAYRNGRDRPTDAYLARSEYGRLLEEFRTRIGEGRMLVLFSEHLKRDPDTEVRRVLRHIGSEAPLETSALHKTFHVGGDELRFKGLPERLRAIPPLRLAWHLIPSTVRKNLFVRYKYDWNIKKKQTSMSEKTRSRLVEFFADDVSFLERTWSLEVPWREFRVSSR